MKISKFKIYHNDKVLFFYEALEVDHNINNVEYVIFVDSIESVEEMLIRKIEDNSKLYEIFLGNVLLNNESTALVFNMKKIVEMMLGGNDGK